MYRNVRPSGAGCTAKSVASPSRSITAWSPSASCITKPGGSAALPATVTSSSPSIDGVFE